MDAYTIGSSGIGFSATAQQTAANYYNQLGYQQQAYTTWTLPKRNLSIIQMILGVRKITQYAGGSLIWGTGTSSVSYL